MILGTIATYSSIFGNLRPVPSSSSLISGISSDLLISYYSFVNSVCFLNPNDRNLELETIGKILEEFPKEEQDGFAVKILQFIDKAKGRPVKFFPTFSLLSCIEDELKRNIRSELAPISKEKERNTLINIFVKNQQIDEEISSRLGDLQAVEEDEKLYRLFWTINIPHSEFQFTKDIYTAAYISLRFLNFIINSPKLSEHTKGFTETSVDYLKELFLLFINARVNHVWKFHSNFKEGSVHENEIVKRITYDLDNNRQFTKRDFVDFRFLRNFPILKVKGNYSVANWNFIIDKFYPGVIYDFLNNTNVRESFKGKDNQAKDNAYFSFIGKYFGEDILFKEIFRKIIITQSPFIIPGNDEDNNFDMFCRIDNHIFLFEYKNFMLPKKLTYDDIKKVIDERLISNKGRKKGILQLVSQIKKLHEFPNAFAGLKGFNKSKARLVIYPIIIYADPVLTTHGINSYLNKIFRDRLNKLNPKLKFRVQDLILISEHFFLENSELFITRKIDMIFLINHYYQKLFNQRKSAKQNKNNPINNHSPFEEVVKNYMGKKNRKKSFNSYYFQHIKQEMFPLETIKKIK
ncbi:MAG: hypothetical protein WD577_14990 [Bacteroidales bacterium]